VNKIAVDMSLVMRVPSPVFLFFLTMVLPFIFFFGHIYFASKSIKTRKKNTFKWIHLWILLVIFIYPIFLFEQAIVQSTAILATSSLDDYISVISVASLYGSLFWSAIRFINVIAIFTIIYLTIYKLIIIRRIKRVKRR